MSLAPMLLEIHVRQWLVELSQRRGREIDLYAIPEDELDRLAESGITHLWLMGVWPTGPLSRREAQTLPTLRRAYEEALPGFADADIAGSPYAVSAYHVPPTLGGDAGLAALRMRLRERGVGLILDFVPNHTGLDFHWAHSRPHLYVGSPTPFADSIALHVGSGSRSVAFGKDPYFPGWTDTLQIDFRRPESRKAVVDLIASVAARCDGVRVDMAMLLLNEVFESTWAHVPVVDAHGHSLPRIGEEFWWKAIADIKALHPDFVFIAEAYWGKEDALIDLGFDFAYDKTLTDRLVHHDGAGAVAHLYGMGERNQRRVHFLENHDEERIATRLDLDEHRAAALLTLALPGVRFLHDGQNEGRRVFARIQLLRRKKEEHDAAIAALYDAILRALRDSCVGDGDAALIPPLPASPGNETHRRFAIIQWQRKGDADSFDVVVINLSPGRAQCRARLTAQGIGAGSFQLTDLLGPQRWVRDGLEMKTEGLFLDVEPWASQLFSFRRRES